MSRGTFGVIGFLCIVAFYSLPFRLLSKKFRTFVRRVPTALSKLCSMCPKRSFDEKSFQTSLFSIILGLCLNFCWWSERFLSVGLSKLYFTCPGELFKRSLILMEKSYCFFCSPISRKKNRQCCRNLIIVSRGSFRRFLENYYGFFIFVAFSQIFSGVLPKIFLQDCQNCFLCVQRIFLG